ETRCDDRRGARVVRLQPPAGDQGVGTLAACRGHQALELADLVAGLGVVRGIVALHPQGDPELFAEGGDRHERRRRVRELHGASGPSSTSTALPSICLLAWAWIAVTIPVTSVASSFSIFIASTTTTGAPASTASPSATSTFTTRPGIGAVTVPPPR